MVQWIEHWPVNQEAAGLIPSQGTCVGCGAGPPFGACERQPIDVGISHTLMFPFPSLFPSLPLSLKVNFLKIIFKTDPYAYSVTSDFTKGPVTNKYLNHKNMFIRQILFPDQHHMCTR